MMPVKAPVTIKPLNMEGSFGTNGNNYYDYSGGSLADNASKSVGSASFPSSSNAGKFSFSSTSSPPDGVVPSLVTGSTKDPDQILVLVGWQCTKDKAGQVSRSKANDMIVVYSLDGIEVPRCHKLG